MGKRDDGSKAEHKCTYNKQIREELLDDAVAEVIIKLVSNPKFASMMQEKINMKVDTSAIEKEIENYQKELKKVILRNLS